MLKNISKVRLMLTETTRALVDVNRTFQRLGEC